MTAVLTGRYQLEAGRDGLLLKVEVHSRQDGFVWRLATAEDLPGLEPMIADGWRFPTERDGVLGQDGRRLRHL